MTSNNSSQCLTVQTAGLSSPRDNNNSVSRGTGLPGSMGPLSPRDRLCSAVVTSISPTGDSKLVKLERRSVRDYRSQDEYMLAMKEDLSEWFNILYELSTTADDLLEQLESGVLLCQLAEQVQQYINRSQGHPTGDDVKVSSLASSSSSPRGPAGLPPWTCPLSPTGHRSSIPLGGTSFHSRDNLCQFLSWCRQALCIPDTLLFETDDLVLRKNERSVVLCLLEVARQGVKFGFPAPVLVQLEQEIDAELAGVVNQQQQQEAAEVLTSVTASGDSVGVRTMDCTNSVNITQRQRSSNNLMSLDEMVRDILGRCTCPVQFSMVRVSEGRYKIGDYQTMIFIRILRSHVMVRIGGGWDTLENFLDRHDPCRCQLKAHKTLSSWTSALTYPMVGRQQQPQQQQQQQQQQQVGCASISSSDDDQTSLKIDLSSLCVDTTSSDSCQPNVNPCDTSHYIAANSQSVSVSDTMQSTTPISLNTRQQKVASITSSVTMPSLVTSCISSSVLTSSVTSPALMSSKSTVSKHLSTNSRLKFPSSSDIRSTQLSSPRQTGNGIRSSVDDARVVQHGRILRGTSTGGSAAERGSITDRGSATAVERGSVTVRGGTTEHHNAAGRSNLADRGRATERGRSTDRNINTAAGQRLPRAQSLGTQSTRQSKQQTIDSTRTQRPSTSTLKYQSTNTKVHHELNPTILFISRSSSGKHVVTCHTSAQQSQLAPKHKNTQQQQQQQRENERTRTRERSTSRETNTRQRQQQNRARSPGQRSAEQKQQQRVRSTSRDRNVRDCESREQSKDRETTQHQVLQSPRQQQQQQQQQTSVSTSRKLLTSGRMSLTAGQLLPNRLKVQRSVTVDNSQTVDTVVNNVNKVSMEPRRALSMTDTSSDSTDSQQISNVNFADTPVTSDTVIQLLSTSDVGLLSHEFEQNSCVGEMQDSALAVSCASLNTNSPQLCVSPASDSSKTVDVICTSSLPPTTFQNADCTSSLPPTSIKSDGMKNSSSCDTFRNLLDTLPDLPPPADHEELNTRMELLFEEYRKVELGLIGQVLKPENGNNATADCRKTRDSQRNGGGSETVNLKSRGRSMSRDRLSSGRMVTPDVKRVDSRNIANGEKVQVAHLCSTGKPVIARPSGRVASASLERSRAHNDIPPALTPRTSTHRSASLQRINKDDGLTASGMIFDKKCGVANGRKENIVSVAGHNCNKARGNKQQSKDNNKLVTVTSSNAILNITATTTTTTAAAVAAVNKQPLLNTTNSAVYSECNVMTNSCQINSDCDVLLGKTNNVNRRRSVGEQHSWRKDKHDNKPPTKIPLPVEMKRKSSLKRVDSGVDINNMSTNDYISV